MIIRNAVSEDYENIYNLVKTAFETARVSDGTEQDFVESLRKSGAFINGLEFVAVDGDKLIGHIMMSRQVVSVGGGELDEVLIAPLCVALEYRGQGIGGKLIEFACIEAHKVGYKAAFLVGDIGYYGRFGFFGIAKSGIKNLSVYPDEHVLMRELEYGALKNISGTINII